MKILPFPFYQKYKLEKEKEKILITVNREDLENILKKTAQLENQNLKFKKLILWGFFSLVFYYSFLA